MKKIIKIIIGLVLVAVAMFWGWRLINKPVDESNSFLNEIKLKLGVKSGVGIDLKSFDELDATSTIEKLAGLQEYNLTETFFNNVGGNVLSAALSKNPNNPQLIKDLSLDVASAQKFD